MTGSRALPTELAHVVHEQLDIAWEKFGPYTLVHGFCPTGADMIADEYFKFLGMEKYIERFPADWSKGRIAGPLRNKQMVETLDKKTDRVIGFIYEESRGTRNCLNYALDAYLPVREVSFSAGLIDVKDYKRA